MSPELWVTLAVGLATPVSLVAVEIIRRRRRNDPPAPDERPKDLDPSA